MQATDNGVKFVRAWIAAATALAVCAGGCRQVDPLGPGSGSISVDRPQILPVEGETATCRVASSVAQTHQELMQNGGSAPTIAARRCPSTPPYKVVEVCRVPADEAGEGIKGSDLFCQTGPEGTSQTTDPPPTDPTPLFPPAEPRDNNFRSRCSEILATTQDNVCCDYANYYTRDTLGEFVVILAPAAVFANTDVDADIDYWYQQHVRSNDTNRAASVFRPLGNGYYTIPAYVSAKFLGEYFDDQPGMALLGEFGDRTTRALLVGAPPLLAVQYLTGGGRPSNVEDNSYWRPFHASNGASGHAFMGAVPFLTLAGMTADPLAKCFFYACSLWTGISRINDNLHYVSQVWLGWWLAYLACDAVHKTETAKGPLLITPLCTPEMTGLGLIYQH